MLLHGFSPSTVQLGLVRSPQLLEHLPTLLRRQQQVLVAGVLAVTVCAQDERLAEARCHQHLECVELGVGEWSVLTHAVCAADESDTRTTLLNELDEKWQLITAELRDVDAAALDVLAIDGDLPVCERCQIGLLRAVSRLQ